MRKRTLLLSITAAGVAGAAALGWVTIRRGFSARAEPSSIETLVATTARKLVELRVLLLLASGQGFQCEPQSQHNFDDWKASQPSRNMSGVRANAATGSAHDLPQTAFTAKPARAIQAI